MSIVGPDGQTPVSSEAEVHMYEVGGVQIAAADTPESMLQKALHGAREMVAQQVGAMVLQSSGGSHMAAQTEAQAAAGKVSNPFQFEPCALGLFMLMTREIEHRDNVIAALAERLDKLDGQSSEELLKKSWPNPLEQVQQNDGEESASPEGEKDAFSEAVKNLSRDNSASN